MKALDAEGLEMPGDERRMRWSIYSACADDTRGKKGEGSVSKMQNILYPHSEAHGESVRGWEFIENFRKNIRARCIRAYS